MTVVNPAAVARPIYSALPEWKERLIKAGAEMSLDVSPYGNIIIHLRFAPDSVRWGAVEQTMLGLRQAWSGVKFNLNGTGWVSLKVLMPDLESLTHEAEWMLRHLKKRRFIPSGMKQREKSVNAQSWRLLRILRSQLARDIAKSLHSSYEEWRKLDQDYQDSVRQFVLDFPEQGERLLKRRM